MLHRAPSNGPQGSLGVVCFDTTVSNHNNLHVYYVRAEAAEASGPLIASIIVVRLTALVIQIHGGKIHNAPLYFEDVIAPNECVGARETGARCLKM